MTGKRFTLFSRAHLSRQHMLAYLEGELSPKSRRKAWQHFQKCADCRNRLMDEQRIRSQLQHEIAGIAFSTTSSGELTALLPGILAKSRTVPTDHIPLHRIIILLCVIGLLILAIPVMQFSFSPLLDSGLPYTTETPVIYDRATLQTTLDFNSPQYNREEEVVSIAYQPEPRIGASPVPLPHLAPTPFPVSSPDGH